MASQTGTSMTSQLAYTPPAVSVQKKAQLVLPLLSTSDNLK